MNRTANPQDRKTIGYVFGGTNIQRQKHVQKLKEDGCYMTLSSATINQKFINFINKEHSGNGIIVCLYVRGYVEYVR